MPARKTIFDDLRAWCLSLPDTKETPTWGKPHFRVGEKIFAGFDDEGGVASAGMKLEKEHADDLVQNDDRVRRAPYVGHKGWVSIDLSRFDDRAQLRDFVLESYRLIAPKKSLSKLGTPAKTPSKKAAAKKKARARKK